MRYEGLVERMTRAYVGADASHIKEHVAIQFNIYGVGEGAFYLEIENGIISVMPFEYFDRDVIVYLTAEVLLKLISGETDIEDAYHSGMLSMEGNVGKAFLLKQIKPKKRRTPAQAKKAADEKKAADGKKTTEKKTPVKKSAANKTAAKKTSAK